MRRAAAAAASLAVLALAFVGLRLWLDATGAPLAARLEPLDPVPAGPLRLVRASGAGARLRVDGALGAHGRAHALSPEALGPGLHVAGLEAEHLGHAPRRVGFGFLVGPFDAPGEALPCSLRVEVHQRLLDRVAQDLEGAVGEALARGGPLGSPIETRLTLTARAPGLSAELRLAFEDGSTLSASTRLKVEPGVHAAVRLRRAARVTSRVSGPLETWASVLGGGVLRALESLVTRPGRGVRGALEAARAAAREKVAAEVAQRVDAWLPDLERRLAGALPAAPALELGGARVELGLSACGPAEVRPGTLLALRYDVRPRATAPAGRIAGGAPPGLGDVRARVPGPVARPPAPLPPLPDGLEADLAVTAAPALVERALEAAWRSGLLDAALEAEEVHGRLEVALAPGAAAQVGAVRLGLPPALTASPEGLSVGVAELGVEVRHPGRPSRWLMLAATGTLAPAPSAGAPAVSLRLERLWSGCVPPGGDGALRRACHQGLVERVERASGADAPLRLVLPEAASAGPVRLTPRRLALSGDGLRLEADLERP